MRKRLLPATLLFSWTLFAQAPKSVLVITSTPGDYLMAAGGTLALMIDQGYTVNVVQIGNDEKNSVGMSPADTRIANKREGSNAARMLGVKEVFILEHKSGELGQVSINEIRNQIFGLVRTYKPRIIFHPDAWVHYQPDWDHYFTGRAAEEFSYGSGEYVGHEFTKMGLAPAGASEVYYYAVNRPYRPGEGGHGGAAFRPVDITKSFERKVAVLQKLETANRRYAMQVKQRLELAGMPSRLLREINRGTMNGLMRAYVEELAETIGKKHNFSYGEEFNYYGPGARVPEHVTERARPVEAPKN